MKNLARFSAVRYLCAVFFVVFHNTGFQWRGLLEARFLTMLLMGVIAFIALLQVIKEEDDKPVDEP